MNKIKMFILLIFILIFSIIVIGNPNVNNFTSEKISNCTNEKPIPYKIEPQPSSNVSKDEWTKDQKIAVASKIIDVLISLAGIIITVVLTIFAPEIRARLLLIIKRPYC